MSYYPSKSTELKHAMRAKVRVRSNSAGSYARKLVADSKRQATKKSSGKK